MPDGGMSAAELAGLKYLCERDHMRFTAYYWRARHGRPMLVNDHHRVMARTLDRVIAGEIKRLIINVPPGYTKTEEAVISFIARGFAINPRARFIHTSFSDLLTRENSTGVKDTLALAEYQELWPVTLRQDTQAKDRWKTMQGGGVLAKAMGGTVTGFRAGLMEEGFTGALIIDDPLKPDDARHDLKRESTNQRYHTTLRNRLAHEDVPIIVIMQRLHDQDFSGYLLAGGSGESWHHLMLPVEIDPADEYPAEWRAGIPIAHGLPPGPLWEAKHNRAQIDVLKADEDTYSAQYMQRPRLGRAEYFKPEWLRPYETPPARETLMVYGASDYAVTADGGDWTVHGVVGIDPKGDMWLLDLWRQRTDSKDWVESFCDLVERWRPIEWAEETGQIKAGVGPFLTERMLARHAYVTRRSFPTRGDKAVRAQSIRGRMSLRGLYIPCNAPWYPTFRINVLRFPQAGVPDDEVDMLGLIGQLLATIESGAPARDQKPAPPTGLESATVDQLWSLNRVHEVD